MVQAVTSARRDVGGAVILVGRVVAADVSEPSSGFTHYGRFAAAYRARYGELPSTTQGLRSAGGRERDLGDDDAVELRPAAPAPRRNVSGYV